MIYPIKDWESAKRGFKFGQKTWYTDHHLGIDHIVPQGTPVYAPCDCEVTVMVGEQGGNTLWAKYIDPEYGILIMRCMHLKNLPTKGNFKQGDIIGYTGNTGKASTGAHLHTDISKNSVIITNFNNFIDPEKYFSQKIQNKSMIIYKKEGENALCVLVGDILIPFATSYDDYKKEFSSAQVVIIPTKDFPQYKVSEIMKIVTK